MMRRRIAGGCLGILALLASPALAAEPAPAIPGWDRLVDGLRVVNTGLTPGESVVINGLLRVRPGMKVLARRATMSDSATLATR